MSDFPRMLYRKGTELPEHGVDYVIVADDEELQIAQADGWTDYASATADPLDHDGDGKKGGSKPRRAKAEEPATE